MARSIGTSQATIGCIVIIITIIILHVADVMKCPGWTPTSCGKIHEDQPGNYWMHRCNPLAIPKNDTTTIMSCKPQAVNGTFQCYFGQVRTLSLES